MTKPVDEENIRDEEADLMFGYSNNKTEVTRTDLISDYLPEGGDWPAKTVLAEEHPEIMAAIERLTSLYPEIAHMEEDLLRFLSQFEKRQTSVRGRSREEFLDILAGMAGGTRSDMEERTKRMQQMLKPLSNSEGEDDS